MSEPGGDRRPGAEQGAGRTRRRRRRRRGGQRVRRDPRQQLEVEASGGLEEAAADDEMSPAALEGGASHSAAEGVRCPICGLAISNLYSAITEQESQQPAHFDCVLRQLAESEELGEGERLAYLGAGSFGVIQLRRRQRGRTRRRQPSGSSGPLLVRKRIEYEEPEPVPEWRQSLVMRAAGTIFVQMESEEEDADARNGAVEPNVDQ